MEFSLGPDLEALRQRVRAFVAAEIMPLESDPASFDEHENVVK